MENRLGEGGRAGVDWESHCDHGIVDVHPFDYISMETTATGRSIVNPPHSDVTFELEELSGDRCRVHMRIRARDRGLGTRAKVALAKPFVEREWRGHFEVLKRLLRDDTSRAERAARGVSGDGAAA